MGREVDTLKRELHQKILDMRSIEATLTKPIFERLWLASDEKQRKVAKQHILNGSKDLLKSWMEFHPDLELGELSLNKLKKLAARYRVPNYSRLTRCEIEPILQELHGKNRDDPEDGCSKELHESNPGGCQDQSRSGEPTTEHRQHSSETY